VRRRRLVFRGLLEGIGSGELMLNVLGAWVLDVMLGPFWAEFRVLGGHHLGFAGERVVCRV
jgi:hypothetical protein